MSDAAPMSGIPLGKKTTYVDQYDASLLYSVDRSDNRRQIGIDGALPFFGGDIWNAYELSWLNEQGKPVVAIGEFYIPCTTPRIAESKSMKLYLNSFNNTRFARLSLVEETIRDDLSAAVDGEVTVNVRELSTVDQSGRFAVPPGKSLDDCNVSPSTYEVTPSLLSDAVDRKSDPIHEIVHTNLFKSNCLVTGQPDWGTMIVEYVGPAISHEKLLLYLISYRRHGGFHEHCVEQVFVDISEHCATRRLTVSARFLRRGGLDINPIRSSTPTTAQNMRMMRQ